MNSNSYFSQLLKDTAETPHYVQNNQTKYQQDLSLVETRPDFHVKRETEQKIEYFNEVYNKSTKSTPKAF